MGWIAFAFLLSSNLLACKVTQENESNLSAGSTSARRPGRRDLEHVGRLGQADAGESQNFLTNSNEPCMYTYTVQGNAGEFDREYLTRLSSCMASLHPDLWEVSDGAWSGMVAYHDSNGTGC